MAPGAVAAPYTLFAAWGGATGSTWYRGTYQQYRTSRRRRGVASYIAIIVIVIRLTQENLHARLSVFLDNRTWQSIQLQVKIINFC